MALMDTLTRARRFNLPTQQRRLRHLRSIAARNIAVRTRPEDADVDISTLDTYLTLHTDKHSKAFFTSEKIKGSLNPTWRSFNLQHINDPSLDTAMQDVVVRVWRGKEDHYRLILEWHVNMTGLVYIGDKVQQDGISYRTNTLIFGMFEGYYSQASPQTPGSSSLGSGVSPEGETSTPSGYTVDTASVRESYGVNSLSRIQTVLRAIKQTQASVKKVRCNIEEKLSQSQALAAKKQDREMLELRVSQLRSEVQWRTEQLQTEKEQHETTQANIHQRDVVLKTKYETLARDKERLHDKKRAYFDVREDLIKTGAQLVMRRKQLISELSLIYPVQELDSGNYTVCGVKLPNSEDFSGQDEIMVAVALGYTTHLVQMINSFLDVPLRYPMEHRGSRSRITDHIHDKLTDKDRDFPLYSKGKEKFQFNYGVYLLNKNIAQLRYYCGLGTTDLRLTLPNLKSLLELRLGVKFDPATNSLGVTPSQHVPLPPNLGGPQKLTSNFNSRLAPRPELLLPDSKTPSRSESEDSKFEQMLQETQRNQEERTKSGEISTLSTPDTSDTSTSPQIASGSSSRERTPSEPVPHQEAEDLFQAAPDSFFEISIKPNAGMISAEGNEVVNEAVAMEIATEQLEMGQDALMGADFGHNNGGVNIPDTEPHSDSSTDVGNVKDAQQLMRNKLLQRSPNDVEADSDVSSNEENINASYGSKFKMWPQDQASFTNSDSEQHLYEDEVSTNHKTYVGNIKRLPQSSSVQGNPHDQKNVHNKAGPSLKTRGNSVGNPYTSSQCDPEPSFSSVSTFKTRAMSLNQPKKSANRGSSRDACFRQTVMPRQGHEINVMTDDCYDDDICERTDALSTNFSTFKTKFPSSHSAMYGPRGVLDDAVPSGGESDH